MSKFKIGDKVRVRKDLDYDGCYGNVWFVDDMDKYKGIETTIKFVDREGDYNLNGCKSYWFSDEMLEKIETKKCVNKLEFEYDEKLQCYFITDGKNTICCKEFGLSKVSDKDQYDKELGNALAYKRFMEDIKHE